MRVIHKYSVPFGNGAYGRFEIQTYSDSTFLHVEMQGHVSCIWAEVDTDSKPVVEHLHVVGTGHEVPADAAHLGTWLDGPYVWHLYALKVPS